MQAAKWVSTNIIAKDELRDNVLVKYEKSEQSPTITVYLYISLPEKEIKERHCNICKEVHKSFFINEQYNCNSCNLNGYQRRADNMMKIKSDYYKGLLGES